MPLLGRDLGRAPVVREGVVVRDAYRLRVLVGRGDERGAVHRELRQGLLGDRSGEVVEVADHRIPPSGQHASRRGALQAAGGAQVGRRARMALVRQGEGPGLHPVHQRATDATAAPLRMDPPAEVAAHAVVVVEGETDAELSVGDEAVVLPDGPGVGLGGEAGLLELLRQVLGGIHLVRPVGVGQHPGELGPRLETVLRQVGPP
jgi:hypothetical protein